MKIQLISFAAATLAVAGMVGCGGASTNMNNSRANVTNLGANNANTGAIVVNSNTNMNANRWSNTNVTREEYDKSRADYEREKGSSTIGSGVNDSWLWFKTRAALLTTSDLRESTINVDVVNDVVTLKGSVATAAQKAKAEEVAKGIKDVKSVKNELKVAPNDSVTNMSSNTTGKK
ncbi:MAG: BON domain-containing protein [Acidobacteriota bacterium]